MSLFGIGLALLGAVLILWFALILIVNTISPRRPRSFDLMERGRYDRKVEKIDIIEGGSIVNQQAHGREMWRRAEVEIPDRPLTFDEELNLRSIIESGNGNVRVKGGDA